MQHSIDHIITQYKVWRVKDLVLTPTITYSSLISMNFYNESFCVIIIPTPTNNIMILYSTVIYNLALWQFKLNPMYTLFKNTTVIFIYMIFCPSAIRSYMLTIEENTSPEYYMDNIQAFHYSILMTFSIHFWQYTVHVSLHMIFYY